MFEASPATKTRNAHKSAYNRSEIRGANSNTDKDSNLPGSYITSTGSCLPADIGQHPRRHKLSFTGHSNFLSKASPVSFNFPQKKHTHIYFWIFLQSVTAHDVLLLLLPNLNTKCDINCQTLTITTN